MLYTYIIYIFTLSVLKKHLTKFNDYFKNNECKLVTEIHL